MSGGSTIRGLLIVDPSTRPPGLLTSSSNAGTIIPKWANCTAPRPHSIFHVASNIRQSNLLCVTVVDAMFGKPSGSRYVFVRSRRDQDRLGRTKSDKHGQKIEG